MVAAAPVVGASLLVPVATASRRATRRGCVQKRTPPRPRTARRCGRGRDAGTWTHRRQPRRRTPHGHNDPLTKNAISRSRRGQTADTQDPTTAAAGRAPTARRRGASAPSRTRRWPRSPKAPRRAARCRRTATRWPAAATRCRPRATTAGCAAPAPAFDAATGLRPSALPAALPGDRPRHVPALGDRTGLRRHRRRRSARRLAPRRRATTPTGRCTRSAVDVHLFRLGDGRASRSRPTAPWRRRPPRGSGCTHDRLRARGPRCTTTSPAAPFARHLAVSRRCAATSTRTPTGWPSSSSAATCTAARPGTRTASTVALKDCPDHYLDQRQGRGRSRTSSSGHARHGHDPVGWPTFKDWPAPHSLTHEGTYYKWMERAWRGGLRIFVNLLVENNQLCKVYPLKRNSCDDMDVDPPAGARTCDKLAALHRRAVRRPRQGLVPHRHRPVPGPPGHQRGQARGRHGHRDQRPVRLHDQARRPGPSCTKASIDRQLDAGAPRWACARWSWSTSSTTRSPASPATTGTTGILVNAANFLETGSFWEMQHCPAGHGPEVHDSDQLAAPGPRPVTQQDALFGAIQQQYGVTLPRAPALRRRAALQHARPDRRSASYTIRGMAKRHMIFDPDHMSVQARKKAARPRSRRCSYPGVVSSHSWSTPDAYPRIYKARRLRHAVRRRQHRLRRQVEAAPDVGRPALLLRLRLRRGHQRPRRAGRPARRRRDRTRSPTRSRASAASPSTSRTAASASTTSTRTASRTTASTRTGSRTSASSAGDDIVDRHEPRPRGLPADVGARRRRQQRRLPRRRG